MSLCLITLERTELQLLMSWALPNLLLVKHLSASVIMFCLCLYNYSPRFHLKTPPNQTALLLNFLLQVIWLLEASVDIQSQLLFHTQNSLLFQVISPWWCGSLYWEHLVSKGTTEAFANVLNLGGLAATGGRSNTAACIYSGLCVLQTALAAVILNWEKICGIHSWILDCKLWWH